MDAKYDTVVDSSLRMSYWMHDYLVHKVRNRQTGGFALVFRKRDIYDGQRREGVSWEALRAISALRKLKSSPNVIQLHDVYVVGRAVSLVVDYATQTVQDLLVSRGALDTEVVRSLGHQLMFGIAACHAKMIMHRNLRPNSLFLTDTGQLKIAAFELTREFSVFLGKYTPNAASLWYRAPECLLGADYYGSAADLWSAGCIIGEMTTGRPLFSGECALDQLILFFKVLGTPTEETWPNLVTLPNFEVLLPKFPKRGLKSMLSNLEVAGIDLVEQLLQYPQEKRPTAKETMEHPFFTKGLQPHEN